MKFKTTARDIRNGYCNKLSIGYCDMQNLLLNRTPIAYTCGVYGWNFDVYDVDGIAVCTGYRGMPGKSPDHAMLREYENAAEKVRYARTVPYERRMEIVDALLREFVNRATDYPCATDAALKEATALIA